MARSNKWGWESGGTRANAYRSFNNYDIAAHVITYDEDPNDGELAYPQGSNPTSVTIPVPEDAYGEEHTHAPTGPLEGASWQCSVIDGKTYCQYSALNPNIWNAYESNTAPGTNEEWDTWATQVGNPTSNSDNHAFHLTLPTGFDSDNAETWEFVDGNPFVICSMYDPDAGNTTFDMKTFHWTDDPVSHPPDPEAEYAWRHTYFDGVGQHAGPCWRDLPPGDGGPWVGSSGAPTLWWDGLTHRHYTGGVMEGIYGETIIIRPASDRIVCSDAQNWYPDNDYEAWGFKTHGKARTVIKADFAWHKGLGDGGFERGTQTFTVPREGDYAYYVSFMFPAGTEGPLHLGIYSDGTLSEEVDLPLESPKFDEDGKLIDDETLIIDSAGVDYHFDAREDFWVEHYAKEPYLIEDGQVYIAINGDDCLLEVSGTVDAGKGMIPGNIYYTPNPTETLDITTCDGGTPKLRLCADIWTIPDEWGDRTCRNSYYSNWLTLDTAYQSLTLDADWNNAPWVEDIEAVVCLIQFKDADRKPLWGDAYNPDTSIEKILWRNLKVRFSGEPSIGGPAWE